MCVTIHIPFRSLTFCNQRYWEDLISRTEATSKVTEFDGGIILGSMAPRNSWKIKTSSGNKLAPYVVGTHLIAHHRSLSCKGLWFLVNWDCSQRQDEQASLQRTRASIPLAAGDFWIMHLHVKSSSFCFTTHYIQTQISEIMNSTRKSLEPAANSPVWHRSVLAQQSAVAAKHTRAATQSRALWATGANLCQPRCNWETNLDFSNIRLTAHSCDPTNY